MQINFKDKKITVMGLGLLGRGIGVAKYLVRKGARVTVTDLKSERDLKPSVEELKKFYRTLRPARGVTKKQKNKIYPIKFVLGKHCVKDFIEADVVFKAAGVPLDSPYIKKVKQKGVLVVMDDSFFAKKSPCPIVGITGTRGKTTTAVLIHKLAVAGGKSIYLAGNVLGTATIPLLDKVKKSDLVVLELSSWQLQGWHDEKISPHIAVVTNIYEDHMNYYKGSMTKYIRDKKAIFKYQTKNDYLVLNKDCQHCRNFAKEAKAKIIWFRKNDVPQNWKLKILGKHNLENIAAAMAVGKLLDLSREKMKKVIESFRGVPGRLELAAELRGVKYYNDTTATMPEATIAALAALGQLKIKNQKSKIKNIILIAGGADKNLDFKELAKTIKKYAKAVILLNGTATPKLQKQLLISNIQYQISLAHGMCEAVKTARKLATRGDVVLLSPACASFGVFKNEFDRGEQFVREVKKM